MPPGARWIEELKQEHPELQALEIEMIDERLEPERANRYDYYYVPTLYVNGVKMHEGAATKQKMDRVLHAAL